MPEIDIQKRENDLVIATFGRSFYVMDDYSFLREITPANLAKPAHIFAIKDTWQFSPSGNASYQGEAYFRTPNPAVAVNIKYHLKEQPQPAQTRRGQQAAEAPAQMLVFTITNSAGDVVTVTERPFEPGVNSFRWNMRIQPQQTAQEGQQAQQAQGFRGGQGGRVAPVGTYYVKMEKKTGDKIELLSEPVPFTTVDLDRELMRFQDLPLMRLIK